MTIPNRCKRNEQYSGNLCLGIDHLFYHHIFWKQELLEAHLLDAGGSRSHENYSGPYRIVGNLHQAIFVDDSFVCQHYGRPRGIDEYHRAYVHF